MRRWLVLVVAVIPIALLLSVVVSSHVEGQRQPAQAPQPDAIAQAQAPARGLPPASPPDPTSALSADSAPPSSSALEDQPEIRATLKNRGALGQTMAKDHL